MKLEMIEAIARYEVKAAAYRAIEEINDTLMLSYRDREIRAYLFLEQLLRDNP